MLFLQSLDSCHEVSAQSATTDSCCCAYISLNRKALNTFSMIQYPQSVYLLQPQQVCFHLFFPRFRLDGRGRKPSRPQIETMCGNAGELYKHFFIIIIIVQVLLFLICICKVGLEVFAPSAVQSELALTPCALVTHSQSYWHANPRVKRKHQQEIHIPLHR